MIVELDKLLKTFRECSCDAVFMVFILTKEPRKNGVKFGIITNFKHTLRADF